MKKVLITILILLTVNLSFCQKPNSIFDTSPQKPTASLELQKAANHYYIGLGLDIVGAALIFGGGEISTWKDLNSESVGKTMQFIGGFTCLAGLVFQIESWSHIHKAGVLLENKEKDITLKFTPTNDGIGLVYNF